MLAGRVNVAFEDVRRVALPALRHRLVLNYDAEAKGMTTERVVAIREGQKRPGVRWASEKLIVVRAHTSTG